MDLDLWGKQMCVELPYIHDKVTMHYCKVPISHYRFAFCHNAMNARNTMYYCAKEEILNRSIENP